MATISDIAEKVGVSKGTVSKALNDAPDISETLRKTILETAVEMGYKRIRRKTEDAKKVCIFVDNMEYTEANHFGYDIVIGFKQMAEPAGFTVDVIPLTDKLQKSSPYDVFMLEHGYIGSFVLGISLNEPWMRDFASATTPTVLYDNYITTNPFVSYVGIDNDEGMDLAVSHLKKLGHKKIGYLSGALGSHILQVRHKSYFRAIKQNGLASDPLLTGSSYYISQCTQKHLPKVIERGATAIICSHDMLANAAIIQCQELGLRVPEDISIIGFDDLPICPYTSPPLTTVRQDRPKLGKCGFYALDSLLNEVPIGTLLLHAQLIVRGSTGKAKLL